ncbi:MAG: HNH endonuclease [Cetobacterium sp.]
MIKINTLKGFEEVKDPYYITTCGRIYSVYKGHYKQIATQNKQVYITIALPVKTVGRDTKRFYVHRILATAFIPNPLNKATVNHIDEVKDNNCLWNLEWMTQQENNNHGTANARRALAKSKPCIQLDSFGKIVRIYKSIKETKLYGYQPSSVSQVCLKHNKTHAGYTWEHFI